MPENQLGNRLQKLLNEKKLSNRRLAEKVGVSGQAIGDIIKGSNPKSALLEKIAKELDTTVQYLLAGEERSDSEIEKENEGLRKELEYLKTIVKQYEELIMLLKNKS